MNKAQKACVKKWNDAFEYRNVSKPDFSRFIEEYNNIDPSPDPEIWVINMYTQYGDVYSSAFSPNQEKGGSKEEADKALETILSARNCELLEYKTGEYLKDKSGDTWRVEKL